jgi:hypothetical protein
MKVLFLDFLHDNADEMGVVILAYAVSYLDIVQSYLNGNGWDINHFLLGTAGQFIYILFAYLAGKRRAGANVDRVGKNLVALFLGGAIGMLTLPFAPFERSLILSTIGIGIGFSFQAVWKRFLAKYVDKLFAESEESSGSINKFSEGEDRPNDPPR